jgi:hypothetical protein
MRSGKLRALASEAVTAKTRADIEHLNADQYGNTLLHYAGSLKPVALVMIAAAVNNADLCALLVGVMGLPQHPNISKLYPLHLACASASLDV